MKRPKSIANQISISIVLVVLGVITAMAIMNSTLLSRVYMINKRKAMVEAFNGIYTASEDRSLYEDDYYYHLESMASRDNLSFLIMTADGSVMVATQGEYDLIKSQMYMILLGGSQGEQSWINRAEDNYTIQLLNDDRSEQEYLVLWGTLSDNNIIMIRTPIASMEESAKLTNRFLIMVGAFALIICIFVSRLLAQHLTRPVKELTNISKKMTELDFDAKYTPKVPGNEIDSLGIHMNELSESLESAIGELKEANVALQKDIEIRDKNEQMRKEFLSNVSHELKTPIAVIQGYAEGLADGISDDPESQQYYCEVIIDEAKRMNVMVRQLLALNQLEYGKSNVQMEHFCLNEMIEGVVGANRILADNSDVKVVAEEFPHTTVWAEEFFAEQVLTNYLTNAIHYAKYDKLVRIHVEDRPKDVRICVFNTGDPIPEDSIDRIWEKFYKVDKSRTREYGGTGIGLSVVKAVMDSFQKNCGVTNYENGVEFWFELDK